MPKTLAKLKRLKREIQKRREEKRWDAFHEPAAWKRSSKGNLWRNWAGKTVSVFARDDNFFGYCIADMDGKRFSQGALETEEEAVESLGFALGLNDLD